jgi:hypothetical protein
MIGSPRMKSVPRIELPTVEQMKACGCYESYKLFGGLGYCKKCSPFLTPQHMGWGRYLYHKTGRMIKATVMPFIILMLVAAITFILYLAALTAVEKQELVACHQHQTYSQSLAGYYLTENEKQRCDDLGVIVYAPVR